MAIENVLLVGATGHLGRYFVSALQEKSKQVHALIRPETAKSLDPAKKSLVDDFKKQGVKIIEGTVEDMPSLERACAEADAIISVIAGPSLAQQVNLAPAAKVSGRVKRIFPSEFGIDQKLAGPGSVALLDWKAAQHDTFKKTGIAITYVYANCFASYWAGGLGQLGLMQPPRDQITVFGTGKVKAAILTTEDIARYTVHMLDDDKTANMEVSILPKDNLLSQDDLITYWEGKAKVKLKRNVVSAENLDAAIKDLSTKLPEKMLDLIFTQLAKSVWVEGSASKKRPEVLDAAELYPQVKYQRITTFLDQFAK